MKKISKVFVFSFFLLFVMTLIPAISAADHANIRKALADINRDGEINKADLNRLQKAYDTVNPVKKKALSDVNQDSKVDILDLSFVGARVGKKVSVCELVDTNKDKKVDQIDMDYVGANYGQNATSANMPADLTGDGKIDLLDLTKAGGVFGCTW